MTWDSAEPLPLIRGDVEGWGNASTLFRMQLPLAIITHRISSFKYWCCSVESAAECGPFKRGQHRCSQVLWPQRDVIVAQMTIQHNCSLPLLTSNTLHHSISLAICWSWPRALSPASLGARPQLPGVFQSPDILSRWCYECGDGSGGDTN